MADAGSDDAAPAQDWMFEQIAAEEPAPVIRTLRRAGGDPDRDHRAHLGDRDLSDEPSPAGDTGPNLHGLHALDSSSHDTAVEPPDADAAAKRTAVWLGSVVLVMAIAIALTFALFGSVDPVPPPIHHSSNPAVTAAPTTANPALPQQDQLVPFTAQTDSCTPAGSSDQAGARSPQALTDTRSDSAWVCGRGPHESLVDGQILHIQFASDATRSASACSYVLNVISVTPGWVAKTSSGKDDWLEHRVVRRLQFNFFNGNQIAADPFFLDTHDVHGPVSAALPSPALASRVEVIILHTERPPAAPSPSVTAPSQTAELPDPPLGAGVDSAPGTTPIGAATAAPDELGPGGGDTAAVDATFAMSQLQFLGHAPH